MYSKYRTLVVCLTLIIILILTLHITLQYRHCRGFAAPYITDINNITKERTIVDIVGCEDKALEKRVVRRGNFVVFENYVKADREFNCGETITLTAPGDYRFLDNVVPVVERWKGPVSVALYAPGYDFFATLQSIAYLRTCTTSLVKEMVTFHLFFEDEHMPTKKGSRLIDIYKDTSDCSLKPPYEVLKDSEMYKTAHKLTYPINVARNIAKTAAQTHFIFPSDIELYPTRNFIPKFLNYIKLHPENARADSKKVFVLPIYEVLANLQVPENKTQLRSMVRKNEAILFHQNVCTSCHKIPKQDEWLNKSETDGLEVFHVSKRQGKQIIWEPFFVCTQKEPLWDERLNWEGQGNKMCQVYTLCILDYDFAVLDNAFLIHKPGVKKKKVQVLKHISEVKKNERILVEIQNDLQNIYGTNKKCKIHNVSVGKKTKK